MVSCDFCGRPRGYTMTDRHLSVAYDDRCTPSTCPGRVGPQIRAVLENGQWLPVDENGMVPDGRHHTEIRAGKLP